MTGRVLAGAATTFDAASKDRDATLTGYDGARPSDEDGRATFEPIPAISEEAVAKREGALLVSEQVPRSFEQRPATFEEGVVDREAASMVHDEAPRDRDGPSMGARAVRAISEENASTSRRARPSPEIALRGVAVAATSVELVRPFVEATAQANEARVAGRAISRAFDEAPAAADEARETADEAPRIVDETGEVVGEPVDTGDEAAGTSDEAIETSDEAVRIDADPSGDVFDARIIGFEEGRDGCLTGSPTSPSGTRPPEAAPR